MGSATGISLPKVSVSETLNTIERIVQQHIGGTLPRMSRAAFYLPSYSESISAGFPSPAEGYEDEPLNLHDWLVRNPAATFFKVEGDTLRHEHIRDGSILVVDRSVVPVVGRLIVA